MRLDKYFFKSLSDYFHIYDSYKVAGKGLLERYVGTLQAETEVYEQEITDIIELPFPQESPEKYLDYISYFLGLPPLLIIDNEQLYRDLLDEIINVYKYKGTAEGFIRYFAIFGLEASFFSVNSSMGIKYDSGSKYDDGWKYDQLCTYCMEVNLLLVIKIDYGITLPASQELLDRIRRAIWVLGPINLTVLSITITEDLPLGYLLEENSDPLSDSGDKLTVIT